MPRLIITNVEQELVERLKEAADRNGVSMEEEHRRILCAALLVRTGKATSFKDYLRSMPADIPDEFFERDR